MKVHLPILALIVLIGSDCSAVKKLAVQPVKVEGVAMEPALRNGDKIFIARSYDRIDRGDIVIFYYPADPSKSYIKRVVGLPNERVEIREGKVLINGESIPEPYVDARNNQAWQSRKEVKVPEGSYYVLGDNRDNSNDSRAWGPLPRHFIYGKFASKYYSAK